MENVSFNFTGKRALVTGAGRGQSIMTLYEINIGVRNPLAAKTENLQF